MKQIIYQFLKRIPKGKVVSYKTIAECFGTSPRAIGKIMNSNKDPDTFPCYKVIRSDGDI
ncbi:MAG: MGMT family protein [bacterium]